MPKNLSLPPTPALCFGNPRGALVGSQGKRRSLSPAAQYSSSWGVNSKAQHELTARPTIFSCWRARPFPFRTVLWAQRSGELCFCPACFSHRRWNSCLAPHNTSCTLGRLTHVPGGQAPLLRLGNQNLEKGRKKEWVIYEPLFSVCSVRWVSMTDKVYRGKRCPELLKLPSNALPRILGEPLINKHPLHLLGRALCILDVQLC